jgi:hypothetical protein
MWLKKFTKDILTDYNGNDYDTGRSLAVFCVLALTVFEGWSVVVLKQPFDAMRYGGGVAAVIACLGVAIFGDSKGRP